MTNYVKEKEIPLKWEENQYRLVTRATNYSQDVQEDVDNVQIEIQSREDILFRRDGVLVFPTEHQLGIED